MRAVRAAVVLVGAMGCAAAQRGEGLDVSAVPAEVRDDYELFAHRCSRCHTLARPLTARVDDIDHWRRYVSRMRRQPGSGIALDDEPGLLRFLGWYMANRRAAGRNL